MTLLQQIRIQAQLRNSGYTRKYELKTLSLPASDYGKLRSLEGAISSDESNTVVLKKE